MRKDRIAQLHIAGVNGVTCYRGAVSVASRQNDDLKQGHWELYQMQHANFVTKDLSLA